MRTAIYAFSGDPITYGHIDIIERASKAFDKLIVGIGVNPDKRYLFDLEERKEMAKRTTSKYPNVEVVSFQGLLVDYAYENGIEVIVKGVRNSTDFEYENALHQVGESQKLGIDTHILFAKPELAHISSSVVKSVQKEQGLITDYVPLYVKQCLESKISEQYILGVTGEIGSGKSYVSREFVKLGISRGIQVHNIELDQIGHRILSELTEPKYVAIRQEIVETFGMQVRKGDGTIDRKSLGDIVFSDPEALNRLNSIMQTPLLVRLRKELYSKKGLILFNAALIAESNMSYLSNNNVVLVYVEKHTQESRLMSRGLTQEQILRRLGSQFDFERKKEYLKRAIDKDAHGNMWILDNSEGKNEIEATFEHILSNLDAK